MNRRDFFHGAALATAAGLPPSRRVGAHPLQRANDDPRPLKPDKSRLRATASRAMVSTSHPYATEAALDALRQGGTAVDAYLTAAITQTVLQPVMTTLGGGLYVTYYDQASNTVAQGGTGFASPAAEDGRLESYDLTTGRTVMVPGYVASVYAISQRWGKLPWRDLFEPAIRYAREGFTIDHLLWGWTFEYSRWLGRNPEGREIWYPDGHLLSVGDTLRQTKLAITLERLRDEGPGYFYTGAWARNFVDAVRAHGGRMTYEDLAQFKIEGDGSWFAADGDTPMPVTRGRFRDYEVVAPANAMMVLALNLVEEGDLRRIGHPSESADALYYLIRIVQEAWHTGLLLRPNNHDVLTSKEYARQVWKIIEGGPPRPYKGISAGTCAITVVDEAGNVACGDHSSSSSPYGTGIIVDGVIANRVVFQHNSTLPSGIFTSLIVMKDGKPAMAIASPSRSFFSTILMNTVNVLEYGMDLWDSVNQPLFGAPGPTYPGEEIETSFGEDLIKQIEKRGMRVMRVAPWEIHMGSCHAVVIDQEAGQLHGVADPRRLGMAKGY